ncbi:MAG: DedA family protein [Clostridiales bacterium]|nr:DedA family protein [Clostridiales bacterium]
METVLKFIYDNGIPAMFIIILLEYACFPVSSEIVLPFAGAFAAAKNTPFLLILALSSLAGVLGTSICYLIGRLGGDRLLHKIMKRFPKTEKSITTSYEKFGKFGSYVVCIGRVIPIIRTYIAFVAGAVEQPYAIFLGFSALGITVWNCLLIGIGYFLRENWTHAISYYTRYKNILIPVLLLIVLFWVARRLRKKNEIKMQECFNEYRRQNRN